MSAELRGGLEGYTKTGRQAAPRASAAAAAARRRSDAGCAPAPAYRDVGQYILTAGRSLQITGRRDPAVMGKALSVSFREDSILQWRSSESIRKLSLGVARIFAIGVYSQIGFISRFGILKGWDLGKLSPPQKIFEFFRLLMVYSNVFDA